MDLKNIQNCTKYFNILYIEDDETISKNITEILESLFNKVVFVKSAEEALARYISKPDFYDIVIADIYLPNMNGIEMIENILKKNSLQKICVLSGFNEPELLKELINLGINGFISKPVSQSELINTLFKIAKNLKQQISLDKYHKSIENNNAYLEKKLFISQKINKYTGLKNRNTLIEDIDKEDYTMLALVDIDYLEFINNLYGAEIGNLIIKKFAKILSDKIEQTPYKLYQISGDQFAIASNDLDSNDFENFIKELSTKLTNLPIYIKEIDEEIYIDATIGVTYELSFMASNGIIYESHLLLVQAGSALKYAKYHKKPLVSYDESMNTLQDVQNIIFWKEKIKQAINDQNIIPVFQPIVDKDGNILKYETLMRLKEIDNGIEKLIPPHFFLDIAIQTKLYARLSYTIIYKAIEYIKNNDISLSINLSFSDIENQKIWNLIENNLKSHNIGKKLIIEIVESEDIKDYSLLLDFIKMIKSYGAKIAMDDFGSGFSNFENIIKFETDYIKIDGSLVKNIDVNLGSFAIVKAIVQFAHTLDIKVIAEYVHSEDVFELLVELGIDEYQGFYFYEPKPNFVKI